MIQVLPDVICIHISLHAVQFLQLCDVDGIGFLFTSSHASNLTSFICCTNGYSRLLGRPCSCSICCCTSGIIPGNTGCCRCFRTAANSHATFFGHFCIMADGDHVRNGRSIHIISGTHNNIVLCIRQGVIIPKDDIGLVRIGAVPGYGIVSPDQVVILPVGQGGVEPFHIVQLRRFIRIIGIAAAGNGVSNAGDLGHIGIFNRVAAAHDHDLTATPRNGFLQCSCHIS